MKKAIGLWLPPLFFRPLLGLACIFLTNCSWVEVAANYLAQPVERDFATRPLYACPWEIPTRWKSDFLGNHRVHYVPASLLMNDIDANGKLNKAGYCDTDGLVSGCILHYIGHTGEYLGSGDIYGDKAMADRQRVDFLGHEACHIYEIEILGIPWQNTNEHKGWEIIPLSGPYRI